MGYMNHIDENGNSQGNFTLLARKKGPHKQWGMHPVGTFLINQNDTTIPVSYFLLGMKLLCQKWPARQIN